MTQAELCEAVAESTGEDHSTILARGFGLIDFGPVYFDPEPYDRSPLVVDWDLDQLAGGLPIPLSDVI